MIIIFIRSGSGVYYIDSKNNTEFVAIVKSIYQKEESQTKQSFYQAKLTRFVEKVLDVLLSQDL